MEKTKTDAEMETARDRDRNRDIGKTNTKHSLCGFVKMSLTLLHNSKFSKLFLTCGVDGNRGLGLRLAVPTDDNEAKLPSLPG